MKRSILVCVLFLLSCVGLSFAQAQLAPNSACPIVIPGATEHPAFCHAETGLIQVMGFHNGVLYGYMGADPNNSDYRKRSCPFGGPTATVPMFCFYASNGPSYSYPAGQPPQENWTYVGNYLQTAGNDYPIEIVFGTNSCSAWKYIYMAAHEVLRAPSDPNNWNFKDVAQPSPADGFTGLPQLQPEDTRSRQASFAIGTNSSGNARLFYGNYPSPQLYSNDTCSAHNNDPAFCPHAYVWHSDDCGATWPAPFAVGEFNANGQPTGLHAQEVHAIEVDPSNLSNIYVMVDTESASLQLNGLWKSTDGGDHFNHLNSQVVNSIDFVFPAGTNNVFAETDGGNGPLHAWDKSNGNFSLPDPFPLYDGIPWDGVAGVGIKLTYDQNIFLGTWGGAHNVLWYLAPPYNSDSMALAQDLMPPIVSITAAQQGKDPVTGNPIIIGTVVTSVPHQLQSEDAINIVGVTPSSYNTQGTLNKPVIQDDYTFTFTYQCPSSAIPVCPGTSPSQGGTGGMVVNDIALSPNRTYEVTDPNTNVTYLYNSEFRFVKPYFTNSPLHIYELSGNSPGAWTYHDLSGPTNMPAFNPLASYFAAGVGDPEQVYYLGDNGHAYIFYQSTNGVWGVNDETSQTGAPPAAPGSPLVSFYAPNTPNWQQVFYVGTNQHIYNLHVSPSGWTYQDTGLTISPSMGIERKLSGFFIPGVGAPVNLFYLSSDGHLIHAYQSSNGVWGVEDDTAITGAPPADPASSVVSFPAPNSPNWMQAFYVGEDQHIYNIYFGPSGWSYADTGGTTPPDSQLSGYFIDGSPTPINLYYLASSGDLIHAYQWTNGVWGFNDDTGLTGAPPAAPGSALTTFNWQNSYYQGSDGHIYHLFFGPNGFTYEDATTLAGAPSAVPVTPLSSFSANSQGYSQHVFFLAVP